MSIGKTESILSDNFEKFPVVECHIRQTRNFHSGVVVESVSKQLSNYYGFKKTLSPRFIHLLLQLVVMNEFSRQVIST